MELLPELARLASVRVLRPPGWSPPANWPAWIDTVPRDEPAATDEIVLIHIGNNPHHLWLAERLIRDRGAVVLHDLVLHHLLVEATEAAGDHAGYARRVEAAHGVAGGALAAARSVGITGRMDPFLFPARRSFLEAATAVIVHSKWAETLIREEYPFLPTARIDLAVADPGPVDRDRERADLGLAADETVIMHLGFLTPEKGLREILAGLGAAVRAGVRARLVVVGEGSEMDSVRRAADAAGIGGSVLATGFLDCERFSTVPAAADLGVVLRSPSAGETSAAVLRFLACGTPVAVGGSRQFLEWPEAAAPRLTPGPSAAPDLARLLGSVGSPGWAERRRAARAAYDAGHRPRDAARALVDVLAEVF
jgi:glycosyltransferase involved in cell wall biosynthesis